MSFIFPKGCKLTLERRYSWSGIFEDSGDSRGYFIVNFPASLCYECLLKCLFVEPILSKASVNPDKMLCLMGTQVLQCQPVAHPNQDRKAQTWSVSNCKLPREGTIGVCRGSSPRTSNPEQGCWAQKSRQARRVTQIDHNNQWWIVQLQVMFLSLDPQSWSWPYQLIASAYRFHISW